MINLLRQFSKLHSDKKQISVGFIGYPNVGKSSIINTLKAKKVCKVAPIAGETKVWQYITLMRRIYLIDCPGVVHPSGDTDTDIVLKGIVRVENVRDPEDHIPTVLERVKPEYLTKTYKISDWTDPEDFLKKLAERMGKLLKKGEPDTNTVAKMVLNDWQRGKLPYFVKPPVPEGMEHKDNNKSKEKTETENEKQIQTNDTNDEVKGPNVRQDFSKVEVELEFSGEDMQTLENESNQLFQSDDEDIDDSEEEEEIEEDNQNEEELKVEKMEENSDNTDEESDEESNERKTKRSAKNNPKRKRKETESPKLKSKQRRKLERDAKTKKVGVHYYETANVKNKNRDKKKLIDLQNSSRGHNKKHLKK